MQNRNILYWIFDVIFLFDAVLIYLPENDMSLIPILLIGLGMTIIHQVYDEKKYFKGMFDHGQKLSIMLFTSFRWFLTITALIIFFSFFYLLSNSLWAMI